MRPTPIAAALLTAALTLTACGGGSDETDADQTPAPAATTTTADPDTSETPEAPTEDPASETALVEAYDTYVHALLTGDGATAYALLSERCQEHEKLSEFAAFSEQAAEIYGDVDYTLNSVTIDGDRGTIDAEYPVEALNQGGGSLWLFENGGWRSDKCD